jgi:hypothetical protein
MPGKWCGGAGSYAGANKPGREGQTVPCPWCKRPVKLVRVLRGDIHYYVFVPRHHKPVDNGNVTL